MLNTWVARRVGIIYAYETLWIKLIEPILVTKNIHFAHNQSTIYKMIAHDTFHAV